MARRTIDDLMWWFGYVKATDLTASQFREFELLHELRAVQDQYAKCRAELDEAWADRDGIGNQNEELRRENARLTAILDEIEELCVSEADRVDSDEE